MPAFSLNDSTPVQVGNLESIIARIYGGVTPSPIPIVYTEANRPANSLPTFYTNGLRSGEGVTVVSFASGELGVFPFLAPRKLTIDRMAVGVTTAAASAQARIGIYNEVGRLRPETLLFDSGDIDCSVVGFKTVVVPNLVIEAGLLWLAIIMTNTTAQIAAFSGAYGGNMGPGMGYIDNSNTFQTVTGWRNVQAYGALPNPFPAAPTGYFTESSSARRLPILGLRFAS